ncbi:HlyD family secretion protein [Caulifigura coniformis]|uniref:HlyD family secretion protein n=1 Tax=Caulifigura coniformis TaxID=2527983 RepID=A0A517SIT9_9PLAN|nr:HlyD family efflux transporter periplasmic adaptor subunit [Caulifigura coniformis]QDT56019.1 HlyD family secretion protein [Caulifigura coniformis]
MPTDLIVVERPRRELRPQRYGPVAFDEASLPALRMAKSSRLARKLALFLMIAMCFAVILMVSAPWQQSVKASGNVIAYAPLERQQVIEAPIKGRIVRLGENIFENAKVQKGAVIAEIQDLDEEYAGRLTAQLRNSEDLVKAAATQLDASRRSFEAALTVTHAYEAQVVAYQTVLDDTTAAQDAYVVQAEEKVRAEERQLEEYKAAIPQLEAEFERSETLHRAGNLALQKLQETERKLNESKAKVSRAEAYVASAKAELEGKTRDRSAKIEKARIDIEYARATLRKAESDANKADADVSKTQQELSKAEKELVESQIKVARQKNQVITAPFDGILVKITANLGTALVKEGDPICTIVPDTEDRAVQIWLDGNDAPLVETGRHVRLQFEGWPAIQFSGWPSVAVGTFGGEIVSVDATDDGKGRFRALIRPAADDIPWPQDRFLRQGVRANGWVLLDQVPLWFEVWRNLNGFPPVVSMDEKDGGSKSKPPKLPK